MEKLKPCPFCGGETEVFKDMASLFFPEKFNVWCKKCGVHTLEFRKRKEAIKVWNKRTQVK